MLHCYLQSYVLSILNQITSCRSRGSIYLECVCWRWLPCPQLDCLKPHFCEAAKISIYFPISTSCVSKRLFIISWYLEFIPASLALLNSQLSLNNNITRLSRGTSEVTRDFGIFVYKISELFQCNIICYFLMQADVCCDLYLKHANKRIFLLLVWRLFSSTSLKPSDVNISILHYVFDIS